MHLILHIEIVSEPEISLIYLNITLPKRIHQTVKNVLLIQVVIIVAILKLIAILKLLLSIDSVIYYI